LMDDNPHILIVDDSVDSLSLLDSQLQGSGYRAIHAATSGDETLRLLGIEGNGGPPMAVDLILLDILMPGTDGIELCRRIRSHERLRNVPIIMVTGITDTATLERAFAAGANDYLVKPVRIIELLARVRSALRLKKEVDLCKARERELLALASQLEEANRELQAVTYIDGLTGVGNRRYFNERIRDEWRRARREYIPLGLIMIDIDAFKSFNDAFGHQRGDECLWQVAQALNGVLNRAGDFVIRYGGEEFAVVLPNTTTAGAVSVAEKLRAATADLGISHSVAKPGGLLTISMGVVAVIPDEGVQVFDFIEAADQALYRAKNSGRDQIVIAESLDGGAPTAISQPGQEAGTGGVEGRNGG
jgi:diguanylate cyclase (GGDEF)-like protein